MNDPQRPSSRLPRDIWALLACYAIIVSGLQLSFDPGGLGPYLYMLSAAAVLFLTRNHPTIQPRRRQLIVWAIGAVIILALSVWYVMSVT